MEPERFNEMTANLNRIDQTGRLRTQEVFLFAHCSATMELADLLLEREIHPKAILDNNPDKYGIDYKGIPVCAPKKILGVKDAIVLIVSRFYEQMALQLRELGFLGDIEKLTDYNSYAEYSLSPDTLMRKSERLRRGINRLRSLKRDYPGYFIVLCPFPALGDVYFCMSYLQHYLKLNGYEKCIVCVVGNAVKQVAELFGYADVLQLSQNDIDEIIQSVIYTNDGDCFIAHQDRPYVVYLHRALYKKCIPLEIIYKCGIFGLSQDIRPVEPKCWIDYSFGDVPVKDKMAIISPYAKSVASLPEKIWEDIVADLKADGYETFTNVIGDEKPLSGTYAISPRISEIKSAVEQAGLFIGIRSGICDVLRTADAKKIALYPDYYYCDTKWKSIDMYSIDGFENIVVKDTDTWKEVKERIQL